MNKKNIIIIVVVLLALGAAFGIWYKGKEADKDIKQMENHIDTSTLWNPYASEYSYLHTLSDFVISAKNGDYILKMTVTLDFDGEENYLKFAGHNSSDAKGFEGVAADGLTPMEFTINDKIGDLIMEADETQLLDKEELKKYIKEGINEEINPESPLLKDVYIENYVVQ